MIFWALVGAVLAAGALLWPSIYMVHYDEDDEIYREIASMDGGAVFPAVDGSIYYIDRNPQEKEKIAVFLNGITQTAHIMDHFLARHIAAAGYRTICFDWFGRGHSDAPTHVEYDDDLYIQQVRDVLHHLQLLDTRVHIVGLSMGGGIAVEYAARYPHHLHSMTLLAPAGLPFPLPLITKLMHMPSVALAFLSSPLGHRIVEKRINASFYDTSLPASVEGASYWHRALYWHHNKPGHQYSFVSTMRNLKALRSIEHQYEKIGHSEHAFPVTMHWGNEDRTVPIECAFHANRVVPRAKIYVYEDASHSIFAEKREQIVDTFLTGKAPHGATLLEAT